MLDKKMKKTKMLKRSRADKIFRIVVLSLLTFIMITIIFPIWTVIVASFCDPTELFSKVFLIFPKKVTLESYRLILRDEDFIRGFANSVMYTSIGTVLNVVMNICGAYPLSRRNLKGRKFFMVMFTFTMFFSGGMIPTYLLVDRLHLIDTVWAMILPTAVGMFNVIIMRTYFENSIPFEIEDAAKVDGSTNFNYLRKIVLPLSKPVIAVVALYYGVSRWNEYFLAMMYLSKRSLYPLQLVLREILLQNQTSGILNVVTDAGYADRMMSRMGLKYAVIVISTLPILIIYPFVQKYFSKGIMVGAVKG